ncbi:hypothetical protein OAS06_02930 [Gammaproteobacteria bacterium]|nr:hypothetical protein [Gammaproteobacteria bacterium]
MKYRVVIRAFTLRRDLGWAFLLKRLLEIQGAKVIIACSRNYSWIVRTWKPHVVVINTISQISNSQANSPGSKIVHWPGEGAEPWNWSDARLLAERPDQFKQLSGIFIWGEDGYEQYKRAFPNEDLEKIILCGNPRLDLIKFDHARHDEDNDSIGFSTRFVTICQYDGRPVLHALTSDQDESSVVPEVNGLIATLRLIRLVLRNTTCRISIRPHPLEAPEYYERYVKAIDPSRISIDSNYDFAFWVKKQKILIAPNSLASVEARLLRKQVIDTDRLSGAEETKVERNEYMKMTLPGEVNRPRNDHEFLMRLDAALKNHEPHEDGREEFDDHLQKTQCWPRDFSAIKKGAERIVELAKSNREVPVRRPLFWAIQMKDYWDVQRRLRRDPLHANINYSPWHHHEDAVYASIAESIISDRPAT